MEDLILRRQDAEVLLTQASADALRLYIFLLTGASMDTAQSLRLSASRLQSAAQELSRLGLMGSLSSSAPRKQTPVVQAAPTPMAPVYSEQEVLSRLRAADEKFKNLVGEFQRRYGRSLSTEEYKSLLVMTEDFHLPHEVVGMLLSFCIQRAQKQGKKRLPAIRSVEREAAKWQELGIVSFERAADYMQQEQQTLCLVQDVARDLYIKDRPLTPGEEQNVRQWLEMGFGRAEIRLAYERNCEEIGKFKWSYCAAILRNWHAAGLHTIEEIERGDPKKDGKPMNKNEQRNAQYQRHGDISPLGLEAIQRLLKEMEEDGIQ